jgi:acetolactate synthase-1/2/3 large subunit
MKVAEFILNFLVKQGVDTVFLVTGGVITPVVDAFAGRKDIKYICVQQEQAAAMAADGYARFKGLGVCMATSGPGATNLITGVGCSYFDSIPVLCITGQVNTHDAKGDSKIRQRGFQETDIVNIVKPITKYAAVVNDPANIQYELNWAVEMAKSGRPGPVLLDIPIDVQMSEFNIPVGGVSFTLENTVPDISGGVSQIVKLIVEAKRPVVIYGQGARNARTELIQFVEATGIPCVPSWAALDLIPHDHPLFVSQFGVYGSRAGNYAVQNADLIIAIGTRLDGRMIGAKGFAPKAKKVIIDLDKAEIEKNNPDVAIQADAKDFLDAINKHDFFPNLKERKIWLDRIHEWKDKYPIKSHVSSLIQPIEFISQLINKLPEDAIIVGDSGANLSWLQQAAYLTGEQRLFSAYGYSPMGYAVQAAIGAYYATGKPIVAICGDGAAQMNIQEFQTLKHYNIPVKVFIINNRSYGIIKQFQEELFEGRYEATDSEGGYSAPDFAAVARAYGLKTLQMLGTAVMEWMTQTVLDYPGAYIADVHIDKSARIEPKTRYGNPIERQHPLLGDEEHAENML